MIHINVMARKMPNFEEPRFVGTIVSNSQVSLGDIVDRISARCTVTKPDVIATLAAFQEQIIYAMRNAQSVSLGNIGSLHLRARVKMAKEGEDFNSNNIESLGVSLRPRKSLLSKVQPGKVQFKVTKPE